LEVNPFFDIIDNMGTELHGSLFGTAYAGAHEPPKKMVGDVYLNVPCTLKEMYNGCMKTVVYERQTLELDGRTLRNHHITK
jgi:DnaJ family protein B protein 13